MRGQRLEVARLQGGGRDAHSHLWLSWTKGGRRWESGTLIHSLSPPTSAA